MAAVMAQQIARVTFASPQLLTMRLISKMGLHRRRHQSVVDLTSEQTEVRMVPPNSVLTISVLRAQQRETSLAHVPKGRQNAPPLWNHHPEEKNSAWTRRSLRPTESDSVPDVQQADLPPV